MAKRNKPSRKKKTAASADQPPRRDALEKDSKPTAKRQPSQQKPSKRSQEHKPFDRAEDSAQARSMNRMRIGTLTILQLILLAVTLLAVNYLSLSYPKRWDLSRDSDYSLSSATLNYLNSPAVQDREQPVKLIMAFRRTSPFYERVRALAEQYDSESGGKIELKVVTTRNEDELEAFCASYGINSFASDLILIDARSDDSPVNIPTTEQTSTLNPHIKPVPLEQMLAHETIAEQRKVTGFQGEELITARLVESIEGRPRRMALIADKSRMGINSPERKTLEELLYFQNISLSEIQISGIDTIPEDVEGLVIASPAYDFSEEEIDVLEDYWNRPRSAMMFLFGDNQTPPNLRTFLRRQGITPHNDRLIARANNGLITRARAGFSHGVDFISELSGQITEFGGSSSSMDIREGAEDLLNRRIFPMALLTVDPRFWGETDFGQDEPSFDEQSDHSKPLYLAAGVIRGAAGDDRFASKVSRMVVITNTDFLDPMHHRAENLDFLSSSANWLVGRESLAGITPRSISTYKLPLFQAQSSFINLCNLIFMPLILFVICGFVWSSRRA